MKTNTAEVPCAPGYYLGVPSRSYHSGPGISKSQLDLLHLAPALLEWSRRAPRDEEARAAVDLGDAFHAIALEPQRFDEEYTGEFVPPPHALVTIDHIKAFMDDRGIGYTSKLNTASPKESACASSVFLSPVLMGPISSIYCFGFSGSSWFRPFSPAANTSGRADAVPWVA